jgi:hypothetical protein
MKIIGLPTFSKTHAFARGQICCSGEEVWATGSTRAIAFDNYKKALKEHKQTTQREKCV